MSMLTPPSPSKRSRAPSTLIPPSSFITPPSKMSRLPMLSTPGRPGGSPSTGIPTPTHRRPRSSLGPSQGHLNASMGQDDAMDQALQEALRSRPPSSLRNKIGLTNGDDPDTPTQLSGSSSATLAPRTPGLRPRTPSALGLGHGPHTPSASRAVSRSSASSRPSLAGSATGFTPRRTSMASSTTSTTPFRRPESRASTANGDDSKWQPVVGERVRMQAMGMEGTLRYIGETEFKAGVWAGVELEGGFAGKGKNDGSVNDVPYFSCPPLCGVFVLASKLSPPTSGPSRPASVASSHRSLASSHASYSLSGRQTPLERPPRSATTTPARANRAVSSSVRGLDDDARPTKTLLGTSTSSNAAMAASKITAGSRASKYLGMTAKQLDNARSGNLTASVRGLNASTATTPKPSRVSMGGATPVRPRQSFGGNFATPKARVPRASNAVDMMPPPPSPNHARTAISQHQTALEEEIRELRKQYSDLEQELKLSQTVTDGDDRQRTEALQAEVDRIREESDSLRQQLSASQADAADASKLAEELQIHQLEAKAVAEERERELMALRKEMKLAAERAQGELDAGMEAKRREVRQMEERAEIAEQDGAEMRALVEELTQAGQATISLYETKQYDLEDKLRNFEEKTRLLEEKLAKAREELETAQPTSTETRSSEALTAAEIDNETLNAQLKHLQHKVSNLEEELEEARVQAESEADSWKARLTKAKEAERVVLDREREIKEEVKRLQRAAEGAKTRITELEGALRENRGALEAAQAEIEGLRSEAAEATTMRAALATAMANEKLLSERSAEVEELKEQLAKDAELEKNLAAVEDAKSSLQVTNSNLQARISSLETEIASLKTTMETNLPKPSSPSSITSRKARLSSGSNDDEKKMRGFQHIISELSTENAELKEKYESVLEEVALLKEEIKLLEETAEFAGDGVKSGGSATELLEAKTTISAHAQTIKELHREVSELESLIESKIYREDELETRLQDMERELERQRKSPTTSTNNGVMAPPLSASREQSSHSRTSSTVDSITTSGEDRCELCEGPHDLDACPVFAGNTLIGEDDRSPLGRKGKTGKWCADCESTAHDTADCPMAEDVF